VGDLKRKRFGTTDEDVDFWKINIDGGESTIGPGCLEI